ncbi:hypothetical protein AB1Y20_008054 [Prymnesium parvum]|uniref:Transmembrane protein n=1 Tax=Prymnesium parvum TaxID=97485 RepID=A0AB34IVI9_PRYPA
MVLYVLSVILSGFAGPTLHQRALVPRATLSCSRHVLCSDGDEGAFDSLRDKIEALRRENAVRKQMNEERARELEDAETPPAEPPAAERDREEASRQLEEEDQGAAEGFRFAEPPRYSAGLDTNPESPEMKLIGLWTAKRSFQLVCAALLFTLGFYLYVGLTGGITDGFDRFSDPIEPLQQTLADPAFEPDMPGMFGLPR